MLGVVAHIITIGERFHASVAASPIHRFRNTGSILLKTHMSSRIEDVTGLANQQGSGRFPQTMVFISSNKRVRGLPANKESGVHCLYVRYHGILCENFDGK